MRINFFSLCRIYILYFFKSPRFVDKIYKVNSEFSRKLLFYKLDSADLSVGGNIQRFNITTYNELQAK